MLPITSMEPASRLAGLTDDFDLSKHEDLLLVEEMELPEQRDKTKSTAGGSGRAASGTAQKETSRNNKTEYLHQQK